MRSEYCYVQLECKKNQTGNGDNDRGLWFLLLPSWSRGCQARVGERHGQVAFVRAAAHAWLHRIYKAFC